MIEPLIVDNSNGGVDDLGPHEFRVSLLEFDGSIVVDLGHIHLVIQVTVQIVELFRKGNEDR